MTDETSGKERKTLLTSATLYADDAHSRVRNPDLVKLEAEIETTLKEARESAEREKLKPVPSDDDKQRREEFREYLQEVTNMARVKGWDIFQPDWKILKTSPCFPVHILVGLMLGIHHCFSSPNWIFYRAIPYFEGEEWAHFPCVPNMPSIESEIDPTQKDGEKAERLKDFLTRRAVILNHLQPRGDLVPIVGAGEFSEIRLSDFIKFAEWMRWDLPNEFRQNLNNSQTNTKQHPGIESDAQRQDDDMSNDMLKLIFIMAVDGYEYVPGKPRNWATGNNS